MHLVQSGYLVDDAQKPSPPLQPHSNSGCWEDADAGDDWPEFETLPCQFSSVSIRDEPMKPLKQTSLDEVVGALTHKSLDDVETMSQKSLTQWYAEDGSSTTTIRESRSSCTSEGSSDSGSLFKPSRQRADG